MSEASLWTCPKCRCPNGAMRTKCLLCGTPAPSAAPSAAVTPPPPPPPTPAPAPAAPTPAPARRSEAPAPPRPAPPSAPKAAPARKPTAISHDAFHHPRPVAPPPGARPPPKAEAPRPAAPPRPPVPTLPDEEATCPVCSRLLVPRRDEFSLGCVECGGRWVDASRIAEALGPLPPPLAPAQRPALRARFPWSPAEPPANARRRCPRCRDDLARGPSSPAGPVWVDRCKAHGHGVWFDRDEWETYLAFVRAGGLSLPPPPHARPFPHLAPDGPLHSDPVWLHLLVQGL